MSPMLAIILTVVLVCFSTLYLFKNAEGHPTPVGYELAKEAIDKIKDWGIWMTGLQTGAIGALGLIAGKEGYTPDNFEQITAFCSLLFFGSSILLSTWVLSSLPSIILRLDTSLNVTPQNDIYHTRIFSFIPIQLGPMTGLKHTYFICGIISFALFAFHRFIQI